MHEEGEWESDCWESLAVLRNPPGFARYPLYADFLESLAVLRNPPGFARYPLGQRIHRALPGTLYTQTSRRRWPS